MYLPELTGTLQVADYYTGALWLDLLRDGCGTGSLHWLRHEVRPRSLDKPTAVRSCLQSDCGTPTKEQAAAREGAQCVEGRDSLEQRLEEGLARGGGGWRSFVSGVAPGATTFDVEGGSGGA